MNEYEKTIFAMGHVLTQEYANAKLNQLRKLMQSIQITSQDALIEEYNRIKSKTSKLTRMQREIVVRVVDGFV